MNQAAEVISGDRVLQSSNSKTPRSHPTIHHLTKSKSVYFYYLITKPSYQRT